VFRQELMWLFADADNKGDSSFSIFFEKELEKLPSEKDKNEVLIKFSEQFSQLSKRGKYYRYTEKENLKSYFSSLVELKIKGDPLKGTDAEFDKIKSDADVFLNEDKRKRVIKFVDVINEK